MNSDDKNYSLFVINSMKEFYEVLDADCAKITNDKFVAFVFRCAEVSFRDDNTMLKSLNFLKKSRFVSMIVIDCYLTDSLMKLIDVADLCYISKRAVTYDGLNTAQLNALNGEIDESEIEYFLDDFFISTLEMKSVGYVHTIKEYFNQLKEYSTLDDTSIQESEKRTFCNLIVQK